jgi:hypothetical protein
MVGLDRFLYNLVWATTTKETSVVLPKDRYKFDGTIFVVVKAIDENGKLIDARRISSLFEMPKHRLVKGIIVKSVITKQKLKKPKRRLFVITKRFNQYLSFNTGFSPSERTTVQLSNYATFGVNYKYFNLSFNLNLRTERDILDKDTFFNSIIRESVLSGGFRLNVSPRRLLPFLGVESIDYQLYATSYETGGKRRLQFSPHTFLVNFNVLPKFRVSSNLQIGREGKFYLNLSGSLNVNSKNKLYIKLHCINERGFSRNNFSLNFWRSL